MSNTGTVNYDAKNHLRRQKKNGLKDKRKLNRRAAAKKHYKMVVLKFTACNSKSKHQAKAVCPVWYRVSRSSWGRRKRVPDLLPVSHCI